jgi:hypothetical protein
MNLHLAEIAAAVEPAAHAVLLEVLLGSRPDLPYRAVRKHLGRPSRLAHVDTPRRTGQRTASRHPGS